MPKEIDLKILNSLVEVKALEVKVFDKVLDR
jgi:hypothetical protein